MSLLFKYLGLLNIIFFGTTVKVLFKYSKTIHFTKHAFSDLAKDKKVGWLFNVSLFIFSIVQVYFAVKVSQTVSGNTTPQEIALFIVGGIFLCLASVISTTNYPLVHHVLAAISALLVSLAVILLALSTLKINFLLGISVLLITFLIPISYFIRKKSTGAYWELVLFGGVFAWNIAMSIPLLFW